MRVVICARSPLLRAGLASCLEAAGAVVLLATGSAANAWATALHRHPDVVVTEELAPQTCAAGLGCAVVLLMSAATATAPLPVSGGAVTTVPPTATLPEIIAAVFGLAPRARPVPRVAAAALPAQQLTGNRHLAQFLSRREREVLCELVRGTSTAMLAAQLHISPSTVRDHVQRVLTKMNAHSRLELVSLAVRDRLVDPATGAWLDAAG